MRMRMRIIIWPVFFFILRVNDQTRFEGSLQAAEHGTQVGVGSGVEWDEPSLFLFQSDAPTGYICFDALMTCIYMCQYCIVPIPSLMLLGDAFMQSLAVCYLYYITLSSCLSHSLPASLPSRLFRPSRLGAVQGSDSSEDAVRDLSFWFAFGATEIAARSAAAKKKALPSPTRAPGVRERGIERQAEG